MVIKDGSNVLQNRLRDVFLKLDLTALVSQFGIFTNLNISKKCSLSIQL
jgi:hypothetical protein